LGSCSEKTAQVEVGSGGLGAPAVHPVELDGVEHGGRLVDALRAVVAQLETESKIRKQIIALFVSSA
jgi:hypothetical protein